MLAIPGLKRGSELPPMFYKLLIVVATMLWGFSFVVVKDAVDAVPPAWLMGIRFTATGAILIAVFHKSLRRNLDAGHLICGVILGVFSFLGFWIQTVGITDTTPGRNAFLTGTYCVMVPFIYWAVARKRPTVFSLIAAVLCITGIGFVSLGDDLSLALRWGDAMTLLSAVFFAVHIVFVAKFSTRHDIMTLTVIQIAASGVLGLAVGAVTESTPQASAFTVDFFMQIGYMVVFASCLAMVFQNVAQAHVPPAQAALLLSLESVFGVLFSVLLYGEQLTLALVLGFALIFAAIVISETLPRPKKNVPAPQRAAGESKGEGANKGRR